MLAAAVDAFADPEASVGLRENREAAVQSLAGIVAGRLADRRAVDLANTWHPALELAAWEFVQAWERPLVAWMHTVAVVVEDLA